MRIAVHYVDKCQGLHTSAHQVSNPLDHLGQLGASALHAAGVASAHDSCELASVPPFAAQPASLQAACSVQ